MNANLVPMAAGHAMPLGVVPASMGPICQGQCAPSAESAVSTVVVRAVLSVARLISTMGEHVPTVDNFARFAVLRGAQSAIQIMLYLQVAVSVLSVLVHASVPRAITIMLVPAPSAMRPA